MLFIAVGLFAGILTTYTGMGGGMVLVLALSALWDPLTALAVSSPALLVGNAHRFSMYRDDLDWSIARRYIAGGFPGAVVGGLVATAVPQAWLQIAMVGMAGVAVGRMALGAKIRPPKSSHLFVGLLVGFVSATGGGGGLIAGPFLLASGLSGRRYVATAAAGAIAIHTGRLMAYGVGGFVDMSTLTYGATIAVAIAMGNLVGDRIRNATPAAWIPRAEIGSVVLCVTLAVLGLR